MTTITTIKFILILKVLLLTLNQNRKLLLWKCNSLLIVPPTGSVELTGFKLAGNWIINPGGVQVQQKKQPLAWITQACTYRWRCISASTDEVAHVKTHKDTDNFLVTQN
jgi:hypothetical protein